jgi:hypothetical protein
VLSEFIGGLWTPGNPLSVNFFKLYGYVLKLCCLKSQHTDVVEYWTTIRYTTLANALPFISDMKLAHYAKIPPRHTFSAQTVATIMSAVVCTAMLKYQINEIPDICQRWLMSLSPLPFH